MAVRWKESAPVTGIHLSSFTYWFSQVSKQKEILIIFSNVFKQIYSVGCDYWKDQQEIWEGNTYHWSQILPCACTIRYNIKTDHKAVNNYNYLPQYSLWMIFKHFNTYKPTILLISFLNSNNVISNILKLFFKEISKYGLMLWLVNMVHTFNEIMMVHIDKALVTTVIP